MKNLTLQDVAASGDREARGAAALIEAGFPESTRLEALSPGSVTRTLAEALGRELERVYEQLGETYDSAFVDTETGDSLEVLVDGLSPRRPWWWRLFRRA